MSGKKQSSVSITFSVTSLGVTYANQSVAIDAVVVGGNNSEKLAIAVPARSVAPTSISLSSVVGRIDMDPLYHEILRAVQRAILALADERDFLGYQLSHAHGMVDDERFEELVEHYLPKSAKFERDKALSTVFFVSLLAPDRVDADFVAAICRCDVDKALSLIEATKSALQKPVIQQLRKSIADQGNQVVMSELIEK